jgi:hypothetical protein
MPHSTTDRDSTRVITGCAPFVLPLRDNHRSSLGAALTNTPALGLVLPVGGALTVSSLTGSASYLARADAVSAQQSLSATLHLTLEPVYSLQALRNDLKHPGIPPDRP